MSTIRCRTFSPSSFRLVSSFSFSGSRPPSAHWPSPCWPLVGETREVRPGSGTRMSPHQNSVRCPRPAIASVLAATGGCGARTSVRVLEDQPQRDSRPRRNKCRGERHVQPIPVHCACLFVWCPPLGHLG